MNMNFSVSTLRIVVIGVALIADARLSFSQGTFQGVFNFSNDGINFGARAPVYGPDPSDPSSQKWGNPTNATPPGTQTYFGPLLAGSNYSVQAWYSTNAVSDPFQLLVSARAVPDSLVPFGSSGHFSGGAPTIPDALPNLGFDPNNSAWWTNSVYYVFLQVRAWDNEGGQLPTWDDAWNAALAGSGRAVGWSKVFWQPLTYPADTKPWPAMPYFESFNTFFIPEPTSGALLLVGGTVLACVSRRMRRRSGGAERSGQ